MQNLKQVKKARARQQLRAMEMATDRLYEVQCAINESRKPNWMRLGVAFGELDLARVPYEGTNFYQEFRRLAKIDEARA